MSGLALHLRLIWQRNSGLWGLYVLLAALLGVYLYLHPGLFSVAGVARFTQNWFPIAVVALAQTLVMLMGGIDLAIGATVSLGCVLAATYVGDSYGGAAFGIAVAVAAGAVIGGAVGAIVALLRIPAIVVTLAASFIIGGIALLVMPRPGGDMPGWLSDGLAGEFPTALLLLVFLLIAWRVLQATPLGQDINAAGNNPQGAFRSGVNVARARITAYAISGALSSFAGVYVAAQTGSGDPLIGTPFILDSITAAVLGGVGFLGGIGTFRGAIAGSLLLAVMINVMFFMGFPPVAQYIAKGLIIVVAMGLRLLRER
jgi:ribose transport system permease protein